MIEKTIQILREAKSQFKNPAVLWSMGKDSTAMLYLIKEAFMGEIPFPVVHIDTGFKFPEMIEYRDRMAKELNINLIIAKNLDALEEGVNPTSDDHFKCCNLLKTEALKKCIKEHGFDALIMSIRRDEHYMRNIERYFSPRNSDFSWSIVRPKTEEEMKEGDAPFVSLQQVELWDNWQTDFAGASHVRVHPILHWTEIDVWEYCRDNKIPLNQLYFAKKKKRYRSLGCFTCTDPIDSEADTIDKIIKELENTTEQERTGRSQNKEGMMRKLRALGYM